MPPSQVRKEEAELRQVAKQSRLARKEAQQRERKQRQRAQRAAAKNGEAPSALISASDVAKRKRGAIILPEEVAELRQRLTGTAPPTPEAATSLPKKNKKTKAESPKNSRVAAKRSLSASSSHNAGATAASSSSCLLEPPYHQEVHFKKKLFMVDVVLHHVPHHKIDVLATNDRQLVVDTSGHTKKYRLELPYPDNMRCDAAAATYELQNGVLQCRLPILDGIIPASLEEENDKLREKMRQQRALRFRVTQDGDLAVRTRQTLLAPNPIAQAALLEAKKNTSAALAHGSEDEGEANTVERNSAGESVVVANQSRKRGRATSAEEEEAKEVLKGGAARSTPKTAAGARRPTATPAADDAANVAVSPARSAAQAKPDIFAAEHAKALEAAKAAAAKVHLSMREKMKMAKVVQASRQERLQTRSLRKERKETQKQQSFQRVLEEQKRQLLARASQQATSAPRSAPKAGAAAKSVRFADA